METATVSCANLRHKGMYVLRDPADDENACYDAYDATVYWCTRTQKALGPDGKPVSHSACIHGRECCR